MEGNVLSQFELFQHYEESGDSDKSQQYFSMCLTSLEKYQLRLKVLRLIDFRKFNDFQLDLSEQLTVLIGDNGSGKTTVLEAITKNLSWLLGNILKEDRTSRPIVDHDVNIASSHKIAESHLHLSLGESHEYRTTLVKNLEENEASKDSELAEIRSLGDMYRVINARKEINRPLLLFYSVERTNESVQNEYSEKSIGKINTRFSAYQNALTGKASIADFIGWFLPIANLAESEERSRKLIEQKEELDTLQNLYENTNNSSGRAMIERLIKQKATSLNALTDGLREGDQFTSQLKFIKAAISTLLPGFSDIYLDRSTGNVAVYVVIDGEKLHINQLSEGQRIILGLGADIARRLTMLNPVIDVLDDASPLNGQGIVLIDEIELHLHPKWQQNILLNLSKTFKNIQFIVTSHSPQVLSTVDKSNIRILDDNGAAVPDFQTQGVMSSDILERIMGTFSIPQMPVTEKLNELGGLIQEGCYETNKATALFKELQQHFGDSHPEIKKLENQVNLVELKRRVQARKRRYK